MTKLLLIRHCETDWTKEERHQGHIDIPLNRIGEERARLIARRVKIEKPKLIYSSNLLRASITAEIIAEILSLNVIKEHSLIELFKGDWEGRTKQEIKSQNPKLVEEWELNPLKTQIPNAESYIQLYDRVIPCIVKIIMSHPDDTIAIVTHANIIRLLVCVALRLEIEHLRRVKVDLGSLTTIIISNNDWRLINLNETFHLYN